eukprot:GHVT01031566.1.p1 GENE.GHVT01031566.1~~GHVT01031566.1.p1  ORF type:complete len:420 (-),score=92.30 GHVT01031566.1:808-2067(-)
MMAEQGVAELLCKRLCLSVRPASSEGRLGIRNSPVSLRTWRRLAERVDSASEEVRIGIVGKYTGLADSYLSVIKALKHSAIEAHLNLKIVWIESTDLEPFEELPEKEKTQEDTKKDDAPGSASGKNENEEKMLKSNNCKKAWETLKSVHGVLCPGGFGDRGIMGKALSAGYCRSSKIPYLGICLGMQTAVIDFARRVLKLEAANSEEFDAATPCPVIVAMPEHTPDAMGGTMRLGKRATIIRDVNSIAYKLYDAHPVIDERHRHRYEVNPDMVAQMESAGLRFVGQDERGQRMEIAEIADHPFFVCVQFHPEFQSRPMCPSPPFLGLVLASVGRLQERLAANGGCLKSGSVYVGGDVALGKSWDHQESQETAAVAAAADKEAAGGKKAGEEGGTGAKKAEEPQPQIGAPKISLPAPILP